VCEIGEVCIGTILFNHLPDQNENERKEGIEREGETDAGEDEGREKGRGDESAGRVEGGIDAETGVESRHDAGVDVDVGSLSN
jgi:hypothetical protein